MPNAAGLYTAASTRAKHALREEAQIVETLYRIGGSVAAELDFARVAQTVTDEATRARLALGGHSC